MMNGIIILSALLPCVPAEIGPHYNDFFEVLLNASYLLLKPGISSSISNVYNLFKS